ncbi:MAG: hypothetical protein Q8P67_07655 [archaeon]|nr:hypothetical protein [archaeon]
MDHAQAEQFEGDVDPTDAELNGTGSQADIDEDLPNFYFQTSMLQPDPSLPVPAASSEPLLLLCRICSKHVPEHLVKGHSVECAAVNPAPLSPLPTPSSSSSSPPPPAAASFSNPTSSSSSAQPSSTFSSSVVPPEAVSSEPQPTTFASSPSPDIQHDEYLPEAEEPEPAYEDPFQQEQAPEQELEQQEPEPEHQKSEPDHEHPEHRPAPPPLPRDASYSNGITLHAHQSEDQAPAESGSAGVDEFGIEATLNLEI